MPRVIEVGVIGMGWMGEVHSRSYRQIVQRFPDCPLQPRLVICADDVEARSSAARVRFGFEKQTTDWRRVIEDPDVEVVNIAAPNNLHLEIVRHAASQGKHIFCEKRVGRNPRETAAIEHIARQAGVMTFVGYNYRWAPLVQYGRKLIQDGPFGQSNSLSRSLLGRIRKRSQGCSLMAAGSIQEIVGMRRTFVTERPWPLLDKGLISRLARKVRLTRSPMKIT